MLPVHSIVTVIKEHKLTEMATLRTNRPEYSIFVAETFIWITYALHEIQSWVISNLGIFSVL